MASVAVATMTWARSMSEAALLERSLRGLSRHGWPIFVTDGGSSDSFLSSVRQVPGVSVSHGSGLVSQVQSSVGAALGSGASLVLYTEPDKEIFFDTGVAGFVAQAADLPMPALGLAARTPEWFGTFPPHQQLTENAINALCGDAFGVAGDYSYGPFLMSHTAAVRVADAPLDLGWGWRHFIFAVAYRLGETPVTLAGDYPCPPDQRGEDPADRAYRYRQLEENCRGLWQGLAMSLDVPRRSGAGKASG